MQDAWASFAISLDSKNALAYQWRAHARTGYGFLAGAQSDWQIALCCASANKAGVLEEVCVLLYSQFSEGA